jgi:uncharacterized membrane protein required for colicin V production
LLLNASEFLAGMNVVDVVILAILLLSMVSGMYKGFISSGLATLGFVGAVAGAILFCPQLANLFQSNNGLMNSLSYYLDAPDLLSKLASTSAAQAASNSTILSQATGALSSLPTSIVDAFKDNVLNQLFNTLNLSSLGDYLSQTIIVSAAYVISFLLIFAACYIVVLLVANLLNNVFHFPLLRHFDWLLGGVFGLLRGAFITMIILSVMPLLLSLLELNVMDKLMAGSQLAHYFTNDSLIRQVISLAFSAK